MTIERAPARSIVLDRIRNADCSSDVSSPAKRSASALGEARRRAPWRRGRCAPSRGRRTAAAPRAGRRSCPRLPVISTISESGDDVDDARAEDVGELHDLRARVSRVAATLISARSRSTDGALGDVLDAQHVDQLVEVRLDAARADRRRLSHDDRHARDAGRLGVADGERLDVERAAPEQRRHAVQHAGLSST